MKQVKEQRCNSGCFVLRNNRCTSVTTDTAIKGVVLDETCYLDIDTLLKTPISREDAVLYSQRMKLTLPTKKQIRLVEKHLSAINDCLLDIGRGDCLLLGEVLKDFWSRYNDGNVPANERRGVLFIVPLQNSY